MRILFVIDSMTKDGAESQLLKTLQRLPSERYEVSVVLSRAEGERAAELVSIPCVREVITLTAEDRRKRLLEKRSLSLALSRRLNPTLCIVGCGIPISSVDSHASAAFGGGSRLSPHSAVITTHDTASFGSG